MSKVLRCIVYGTGTIPFIAVKPTDCIKDIKEAIVTFRKMEIWPLHGLGLLETT